jgi:hypothetical protein
VIYYVYSKDKLYITPNKTQEPIWIHSRIHIALFKRYNTKGILCLNKLTNINYS